MYTILTLLFNVDTMITINNNCNFTTNIYFLGHIYNLFQKKRQWHHSWADTGLDDTEQILRILQQSTSLADAIEDAHCS